MLRLLIVFTTLACFSAAALAAEPRSEILIADFEAEDYGKWKVEGTAFGPGPAAGTLRDQMPVSGFLGKRLVNTFHGGDDALGKLTSPEFKIERDFINFLIGGGAHPGETCINLVIDGKPVRTATGPNDRAGGSEELDWASWDVKDLAGQTARIEIVDARKGGWGHINVDHIVQSDRKAALATARREFIVGKRYLHLPVKNGAAKRRARLHEGDKLRREFEIELATESPDFWVFIDLEKDQGKKLALEVDRLAQGSYALAAIAQSDNIPEADKLYQEKYRPGFHFTSRRGWLNDPNGLVYYDGEWHLFYQHNPYGWAWGNMHWGHAVSKDLFRWQELPIALAPPRWDDFAFSGSAVVDKANTSGFKTGKEDVLVAAFTSTGRGECIAFSNDRGRTWQEYEKNPVVKHVGRDPKIIWHAPTKRWVMAVYSEDAGKQWIAFHISPDLKTWEFTSRIDGWYECPDIFELPVPDSDATKWVLYAADGKYALGSFDGRAFKSDGPKQTLWYGSFYAAQTYSDAPNNRRVQIGWARGVDFPGMPFNQQMNVPVELSLRRVGSAHLSNADGGQSPPYRMTAQPVKELESLEEKLLKDEASRGELARLSLSLDTTKADVTKITTRGLDITYDAKLKILKCNAVSAPVAPGEDGLVQLELLVDRGSLEIFVNGGEAVLAIGHLFAAENRDLLQVEPAGALRSSRVTLLKDAMKSK